MRRLLPLLLVLLAFDALAVDLTGTVADSAGKPIGRATVSIYMAFPRTGVSAICPSCYRDCGKSVTTDQRGQFRVAGLDKSLVFRVLAVADGYEPKFAEGVDAVKGPLSVRLAPRNAADANLLVRGRVVDPKGKPVVGATAHFHALRVGRRTGYGNIPGVDPLSITDGNGIFVLKVPQADATLDVRIRARNLAPTIATALPPAAEPRDIKLSVGATITGRVVRDGKPVSSARVALIQTNRFSRDWLGPEEIGTDEQGRFLLLAVKPDEEYVLHGFMADGPSFQTRPVKSGAVSSTVDAGTLEVRRGHRVAGYIVRSGGARLPHALRVTLTRVGEDIQIAEVGADGAFAFENVPAELVRLAIPRFVFTDGRRQVEITPTRDVTDLMLEIK